MHQALHGYAEGHRQLAFSKQLSSRDQKTLLALSDISGAGARLDPHGYLTGYPLVDSGVYALARTWPAPEMSRPGCVWTHTLLVDFADLAVCQSLTALNTMFKRPNDSGDLSIYRSPLAMHSNSGERAASWPDPWVRQLISAVYGQPKNRLVIGRAWPDIEELILELWSQQWPRLRRGFRFCTFSAADRSVESTPFDLQILPSLDRSARMRFAGAIDVESIAPLYEAWVDDAIEDLREPDREGLRSFFRRLGSDVLTGREAFKALCQLHVTMHSFSSDPAAFGRAYNLIQSSLGAEAGTARSLVAKAAIERVDQVDDQTFEILWSGLHSIDETDLADAATRLGRAAWRREPQLLANIRHDERLVRLVVAPTLATLATEELLEGVWRVPDLLPQVLSIRPELASEPEFWRSVGDVEQGFAAARLSGHEMQAMEAMIEAGRSDLFGRAGREFGYKYLLSAMEKSFHDARETVVKWLRSAPLDESAVASYLRTAASVDKEFLVALMRQLRPDALTGEIDDDPLLSAWRRSRGALSGDDSLYAAAFFFSRALTYRSRFSAELAQLGFESAYEAVERNQLSDSAWRLLDSRLPFPIFWFQENRAERMRMGVVELFVRRDLSPETFGRLVRDGKLFISLAESLAESSRGRGYLKRVRQSLINDRADGMQARVKIIDRLLK
ncbi:hypothetical protein LVB87_12640 [Lysobacter sp. KIS68-7]|uniref:GAP1-N1 domain-containing protein n=1 Tax=Lysobacter sp. KIS68-7 TaxID=2904252 RepID=UPI001E475A05|nr:hypothetical protein [Lysobacter sp. KIS68-7]UHQ19022.1 hypothetical protein LVB87_12640 [Lysobacter sp. KIS68-7]